MEYKCMLNMYTLSHCLDFCMHAGPTPTPTLLLTH